MGEKAGGRRRKRERERAGGQWAREGRGRSSFEVPYFPQSSRLGYAELKHLVDFLLTR